jgi:hypothetical protein
VGPSTQEKIAAFTPSEMGPALTTAAHCTVAARASDVAFGANVSSGAEAVRLPGVVSREILANSAVPPLLSWQRREIALRVRRIRHATWFPPPMSRRAAGPMPRAFRRW